MDNSPLRTLPAELRNNIYELVLYRPECIAISKENGRLQLQSEHQFEHITALTATCSEIRGEASPIFFAINRFKLLTDQFSRKRSLSDIEARGRAFLLRCAKSIGQRNIQSLRHVEIHIGMTVRWEWYGWDCRDEVDFSIPLNTSINAEAMLVTLEKEQEQKVETLASRGQWGPPFGPVQCSMAKKYVNKVFDHLHTALGCNDRSQ
ncbi:hypothetical protein LTR37_019511 [Vermiconidia calcicola]|uniref:Uncharacterized protein n=1 Tax=Vermiconidia calcicola TaxID=1690605 RepID=A0ACC3ME50_9PEZI|nr:hypothetical protein LTR37_019511 [Vermiconidia calcicola]